MLFLGWLFWVLSALGLFHSYLLFPFLVARFARHAESNQVVYEKEDPELPMVSILCSLYNEEPVLDEKISSLLALDYPADKLRFFFGSDCSNDGSNAILEKASTEHPNFENFLFKERRGKPGVINELAQNAISLNGSGPAHILMITDANVLLAPNTLYELVKHYRNETIALVDGRMKHKDLREVGISKVENTYLSREVLLKHQEGKLWGLMMGPSGGCYTLRSDYFVPVPDKYLVDDFYIAMSTLKKGGKAISELQALCYEDVNDNWKIEFKRKRRISAGNFQNMAFFYKQWWPPFNKLGFIFFSHKILRWLGPFFMLGIILGFGILCLMGNLLFGKLLFLMILSGIFFLLIGPILNRLGLNWFFIKGVRYFLLMNLALFSGFFKYIKGIKNNVWDPTKRHG